MATIPKPRPGDWYVCIENHTSDLGVFREGDRLRGDHPDVQQSPIWWAPADLDSEQRHALRQARLAAAYPIVEES